MGKKRSNSSSDEEDHNNVDETEVTTKTEDDDEDPAVANDDDEEDAKPKRKRQRKRKKKSSATEDNATDGEHATTHKHSSSNSGEDDISSTVYVKGFPFDATEDDIREFFTNGGIPESEIMEMRLARWQDSGRLRGYGHIAFKTSNSASKALELNGKYLNKRYLIIEKPNLPKVLQQQQEHRVQPDGCKTIFIKNLPYDCTEAEVLDVLEDKCGKILDGGVRLPQNASRQLKGFGYVEFKNPEGAASAVELAKKPFGLCVKGRPLFVDYEENNRAKGSFRTTDGQLWRKKYGNQRY